MTIGHCGTVAGTAIKLRSNDWTCRTILGWVKYVWAKICGTMDAINWEYHELMPIIDTFIYNFIFLINNLIIRLFIILFIYYIWK